MKRLITALPCLLLTPVLWGQSFNVDFGDPNSSHGAPPSTYAAAGPAGHWNTVGPSGAASLTTIGGVATGVSVTFVGNMTAVECDNSGTLAGDDALLDDRLRFSGFHTGVRVIFSNLEPGNYRVLLYSIHGSQLSCYPDQLLVSVDGVWQDVWTIWNGGFQETENHSVHFADRPNGGTLEVWAEGQIYDPVWISGVQIERLSQIDSFCYGDGSSAACPCGNNGVAGAGCANSTGNGGRIDATGSTSSSADDLIITASGLVPGGQALLFAGESQISAVPFGDGLLCVTGDVVRLGAKTPDGVGAATWGPDLGAMGKFLAGSRYHLQVWYRDPTSSPCGSDFNLTQALLADYVP